MSTKGTGAARYAGTRVHRVEDARLLQGRGTFVDDVVRPGMPHACGPFDLARLAAAAFAANEPDADGGRGVIVHTASISAFDGQVTMVPYAAAKGAMVSMTLPMARDLAPLGIRVCTIAPGAFATPRLSSPRVQQLLVRDVAFPKRVGNPDEYASLVEQIVTNPYLNGEVIRLDGGARLSPQMR